MASVAQGRGVGVKGRVAGLHAGKAHESSRGGGSVRWAAGAHGGRRATGPADALTWRRGRRRGVHGLCAQPEAAAASAGSARQHVFVSEVVAARVAAAGPAPAAAAPAAAEPVGRLAEGLAGATSLRPAARGRPGRALCVACARVALHGETWMRSWGDMDAITQQASLQAPTLRRHPATRTTGPCRGAPPAHPASASSPKEGPPAGRCAARGPPLGTRPPPPSPGPSGCGRLREPGRPRRPAAGAPPASAPSPNPSSSGGAGPAGPPWPGRAP
jgi:hypothetical protein